eukprot:306535-Chlamydomonas_euryale.AAC.1
MRGGERGRGGRSRGYSAGTHAGRPAGLGLAVTDMGREGHGRGLLRAGNLKGGGDERRPRGWPAGRGVCVAATCQVREDDLRSRNARGRGGGRGEACRPGVLYSSSRQGPAAVEEGLHAPPG